MALEIKSCLACGAGLGDCSTCDYCGSTHLITSKGSGLACRQCGCGNLPNAANCNQCGNSLLQACVECSHRNPIGSRYCAECKIDVHDYRRPKLYQKPLKIQKGDLDKALHGFLASGWFRARDSHKTVLMDAQLNWCPVWVFHSECDGHVQGQKAQTHYKTEVKKQYQAGEDDDRFQVSIQPVQRDGYSGPKKPGKWVDKVESVPYTIWQEVRKEFKKSFRLTKRAYDHKELNNRVGDTTGRSDFIETLPTAGHDWENVLEPILADRDIFNEFKKDIEKSLRATLLDRVEIIEIYHRGPILKLVFVPVWALIYRYKRKRKRCWIDGVSGKVHGQSINLLTQWFS
jgi:hypothetical protein